MNLPQRRRHRIIWLIFALLLPLLFLLSILMIPQRAVQQVEPEQTSMESSTPKAENSQENE